MKSSCAFIAAILLPGSVSAGGFDVDFEWTYPSPGDRTIKLRATDTGGRFAEAVRGVTVTEDRVAFIRGDSNVDGATDISDAVAILNYLFLGRKRVPCEPAGDANDDGALDISDAVYTLSFLFLGGNPIKPPVGTCGFDPSGHDLPCDSFPRCE